MVIPRYLMTRRKVPPEKKQIPLVFKLPRELMHQIDTHIEEHPEEGNRSEFIRTAIRNYLREFKD